jgi:hypothetical protein
MAEEYSILYNSNNFIFIHLSLTVDDLILASYEHEIIFVAFIVQRYKLALFLMT